VLMCDTVPSPWGYEAVMGENSFFHATRGNIYHFFGDRGSMAFPEMKKYFYRDPGKAGWQHEMNSEDRSVPSRDPYPDQMRHFCNVIRGRENPRTGGRDALTSLKAAMAVKKSAETGKPVELQPD